MFFKRRYYPIKLRFGILKYKTIVWGIFITAILLKVFPSIFIYLYSSRSSTTLVQTNFPIIPTVTILGGTALHIILIWLLCEALYLILNDSQSIINKNQDQE